jgi:hypothetical protein
MMSIISTKRMVTEEVEILLELRRGGYLVAVPPGDGDDAYAIALARGEDDRSRSSYSCDRDNPSTRDDDDDDDVDARAMSDGVAIEENGMTTTTLTRSRLPMGGYVVSNDMFHDAIRRDDNRHGTNDRRHVPPPLNCRSSSIRGWLSRRRISFSFANIGTSSHVDERNRLAFVPNPRNDLIEAIDAWNRARIGMR